MHTAKSNTRRRRVPASWGLGHWLMLALVAFYFAVSSGCATAPRPPPRVTTQSEQAAVTPHVTLTSNQRTGHDCDELRGTLPVVDGLTVGAIGDVAVNEAAHGSCQKDRADGLVSIFDALNAAWLRYAATH